jgi:hypothetical protein
VKFIAANDYINKESQINNFISQGTEKGKLNLESGQERK